MTDERKNNRRISRRVVLHGVQLAVTAGVVARAASSASMAQATVSQADAKYQDMPNGQQHCDGCRHFAPPNACGVVQGTISASGWCQLYSAKG